MKKIIIGALVIISTFGFTSCKKDYNCVCRFNNAEVWTRSYENVTRAQAEDRCDGDYVSAAGGLQWDCDVEMD